MNYFISDENTNQNSNYFTVGEYSSLTTIEVECFRILCLNIRSFSKNIDELEVMLDCIKEKPQVVVVTETWFYESNQLGCFLEGYEAHHSIRGRGGGVSVFYMKGIDCAKCDSLSMVNSSIETCCVKFNVTRPFYVLAIYRPHSDSINTFTDSLEQILNSHELSNSSLCLMGDFNANILNSDCSQCTNLTQFLHSYHFIPLINSPTRFSANSAPSLLDHVWINFFDYKSTGIISYDLTDHCPIFIHLDIRMTQNVSKNKIVKFRLINEESLEKFIYDICNISWDSTLVGTLDEKLETFIRIIDEFYCKNFKLKTKMYSSNTVQKPWITPAIKCSIKKKSIYFKMYKSGLISLSFRNRYRNNLNRIIKSAKNDYYMNKFQSIQKNSKKTWNLINRVTNRKNINQNIEKIKFNDETITDEFEASNVFNEFFVNIGSRLSNALPPPNNDFTQYLTSPSVQSFYCFNVTPTECERIISCLKNTRSNLNSIPVFLFKKIASYVSLPLSELINISFKDGVFPKCLKMARVTPLFKSGDKLSVNNFRPISIFNFYVKIFEKCMVNRMVSYLSKFNIICSEQFGFLKGKSTFDAINSLIEYIYSSFNNKNNCISVFLDMRKAFDTVDHKILLQKLEYYGFRGRSLKWFLSYLEERRQVVKFGNSTSNELRLSVGVPQGSNLGPILFLIYINDIVKSSTKLHFSMFADDTVITLKCQNMSQIVSLVNQELQHVSNWLLANRLTLNYEKTNWMFFSTSVKGYVFPSESIKINNITLCQCHEMRYLGVILDSGLNFGKHIDMMCRKISRSIGIFYRLRQFVPSNVLLTLYYSLVYPLMIYCILIWGSTYDTHLNKLVLLQKRIIRLATNSTYYSHTTALFHKTNTLKFLDVFRLYLGSYAFCENSECNFSFVSHDYNTRNRENPVPSYQRLTMTQRSLKYLAPMHFNQIPADLKLSRKICVFKRKYKEFLLSAYS